MKTYFGKVGLAVAAFGAVALNSSLVFAEALTAAQISTSDATANITLVGIAMITLVLLKYGIKVAKAMIS